MCSAEILDMITGKVSALAKTVFGTMLDSVVLYGSYARGEQTEESDIDMMVLADVPAESLSAYKKDFIKLSSSLGLEHDVVVTVTLKDRATFNKYFSVMPFYRNVLEEGIKIA